MFDKHTLPDNFEIEELFQETFNISLVRNSFVKKVLQKNA